MNACEKAVCLVCISVSSWTSDVCGQGTFQNLNFESAVIVTVINPYAEFSSAFPSWTGYIGGIQQDLALYNNMALDSSAVGIIPSSWPYTGFIQGNYTALLQAGLALGTANEADAALAQSGLVPNSATSLRFRAQHGGGPYGTGPGNLVLSIGGQVVPFFPLMVATNFTYYGADIRPWAGQAQELRFTAVSPRPHADNNNWFLDSITFSDVPIPEPSVFSLAGLSILIRVLRRHKP